MLPTITGEFSVIAEPEIRFSDNGRAWAKIRGAAKDRVRDGNGGWTDGDKMYIDIIIGTGAEHLIESIAKGDSIIVTGKLKQREYEKDGEKRIAYQINADSHGVSTRWGTARTKLAGDQPTGVKAAQQTFGAEIINQDTEAPF